MTGVDLVYITAPSQDVARELATALVREGLAACVNLLPQITSIYRWEGAIEKENEILMIAKIASGQRREVTRRVRELHPYDEPEVVITPVVDGSESYLRWVREDPRGT